MNKKKCFHFALLKGQKKNVPKAKNVSFAFMNPSSMKTLNYSKGSLVLIHTEQGQLLLKCWPCSSVEISSLMLSSELFFQNYLKGPAYCDLYDLFLDSSDMVILSCDKHRSFMETDLFKKFLKMQLVPVYITEGLNFNITYLGYPCSFKVGKIYSFSTDKITYQESVIDICSDMSSLNINESNSFLENSLSESLTPFCSTPISKHTISHTNQKMKLVKQFYTVLSSTKIIIDNSKKINPHAKQIFLHHLGGLKEQISKMEALIVPLLKQDSVNEANSCGVILIGAPGSGKTAVVQAVSNEYHIPILNVNDVLCGSNEANYKYQFKRLYNEVVDSSPCILFLDDIDSLCKNGSKAFPDSESEVVLLLSTMICDILNSRHNVLIVGATREIASVDTSLRKHATFQKEIYFGTPSANERKEILNKILHRKYHHNLNSNQVAEISEMAHGFTGGDLITLCNKVEILSPEAFITYEDLKETLKNVKPASMTEFLFEVPKVKWSDIGGMHAVKTAITEMVDWPLKHAKQFKNFGITPSRGILLYGPPGCSKTMIAKALVSESQLNFISIKGPQLFKKYVGESEKLVSELFKKARSAAPCVLFFDEIDSLTSVRGSTSGNSNVSERILTQLLVEIDGIDVLQGVCIIAATNRPNMIDPSFLRPGRFDQMIYVPLPDTTTRKEIFNAKLRNMPLAPDIDISYLVEATEGYTGAEITGVCREAALSAIEKHITSSSSTVTMLHFHTALKSVVPKTSKEMIDFYENYSKRSVT